MTSGHLIDRQAALDWQRGHAQANEYQEAERMTILSRLTREKARTMFISLRRAGKALAEAGGNLDALECLKIERLIERRRILDRLAARRLRHD